MLGLTEWNQKMIQLYISLQETPLYLNTQIA